MKTIANLAAAISAAVVAAAVDKAFSLERAGFKCTLTEANHSTYESEGGAAVSLCWGQDDEGEWEDIRYWPVGCDNALYHPRYV